MAAGTAPPRLDARAWTGPALVAGAAATSMGAVAVVDPNVAGSWPLCPSLSWFGVLCPFCGGLRSAHGLSELDLVAAVDANPLVPLLVLAAALGWARWVARLWRGTPRRRLLPRWAASATVVVLVLFGVLRNLPGLELLAP